MTDTRYTLPRSARPADLYAWIADFVTNRNLDAAEDIEILPSIPLLQARRGVEKATVPGVLMFDRAMNAPVVAKNGAFERFGTMPDVVLEYREPALTDGFVVDFGTPRAVRYNNLVRDVMPGGAFPGPTSSHSMLLEAGEYLVDGYILLAGRTTGLDAEGYLSINEVGMASELSLGASFSVLKPSGGFNNMSYSLSSSFTLTQQTEVIMVVTVTSSGRSCFMGKQHTDASKDNVYSRLNVWRVA